MSPARSRARAKIGAELASLSAPSLAPQMFLAQSARAALFGLDAFEANLRIWRAVGDALSEVAKHQQDATLQSMRSHLSTSSGEAIAPVGGASAATPLESVRAAYENVGEAMLAAQRRMLESISSAASTH